jgi:uncharacterized membrane protein (Fun14 family)
VLQLTPLIARETEDFQIYQNIWVANVVGHCLMALAAAFAIAFILGLRKRQEMKLQRLREIADRY